MEKFWRIFPWVLSLGEFVIIIYLLVSWVNKLPEEPRLPSPIPEATTSASPASSEENPVMESKFKIGDRVGIAVNTNLRDKPSGELIQTLSKDEELELTDGPISKKGSWWWKSKVASTTAEKSEQLLGLTGYISEGYWLKKK